ncbi:T-complex protein 1 subunit delta [Striga hermonthica]|uniref:T-complex protein 1 subunit delta n=1 Tax=Striga hermonthica TaxID=68872 RepID=A0A9N7MTC1_STRHE|nr:T-complex protein 1 subunit delta [Striga hermonthica]
MAAPTVSKARSTETFVDNKRKDDIRMANIASAQSVADAVRTSLGPKGMDKMISTSSGEVIITNDGATILNKMEVLQPAAKFLVELSKSQDVVAGDGTTTVVVIAGSLLKASLGLLTSGIHPTIVSDSLHKTSIKAVEILSAMAVPVELSDRESLVKSASTSLNSKVVSQYSTLLAPLAVDAVLSVVDPQKPDLVDLKDIRIVKKLGGTVDDTELVRGLVFDKKVSHAAGGPTRAENAKIAVIQFQISPPKTDIEQSIVVSDYSQMDRILKEERTYILGMIKKIKATGCNVLLIQKSILRDAVTDLSLHYLAKAKILVIRDVERDEIENRHAQGEINAGINVRKGQITNILEENVVQPLLVSTSAITLSTECVRMILKIDDIVTVR